MITVFTPTYNRAYTLSRLYESLLNQTCPDFEWLIVDDGSTDNTENLVQSFIADNKLRIRYYKQPNGGKHRAINRGVQEAKGELFFIVDSDDYLEPMAIENYSSQFNAIRNIPGFAGISGRRKYPDDRIIGSELPFAFIDCTSLELRMKYGVSGDMAEAYRTDILKKFPFPEVSGENFCPEAMVWNRIAQIYKLRFFRQGSYICEYLPGGLTSKIGALRMKSPITSMAYYAELENLNIPLKEKIKANINYWRFSFNSSLSIMAKLKLVNPIRTLIGFPIGLLMFLNDKRKI